MVIDHLRKSARDAQLSRSLQFFICGWVKGYALPKIASERMYVDLVQLYNSTPICTPRQTGVKIHTANMNFDATQNLHDIHRDGV